MQSCLSEAAYKLNRHTGTHTGCPNQKIRAVCALKAKLRAKKVQIYLAATY